MELERLVELELRQLYQLKLQKEMIEGRITSLVASLAVERGEEYAINFFFKCKE